MVDENLKNQSDLFYSLSYQDRLKFWDDKNFTFHYDVKEIEGVAVTIQPQTTTERLIYNKWIINHWKFKYHEEGFGDKLGLNDLLYKSFDVYVEQFSNRIMGLNISSKRKAISEEIFNILDAIAKTGIKKNLAKELLVKFTTNKESDIYHYKSDVVSSLVDLRHIAQVWEMMKYYSYLKKQKKNLGKPKKDDELKPVQLILLFDHQIKIIYDYLKKEDFIDKQTTYKNLKYALMQNHEKLKKKILWLDMNDSHSSDKTTLLFFGSGLVVGGMETKVGDVYSFLSTYFETYVNDKLTDVKPTTLKQSKQLIDFEKIKERQQNIISLFDDIK
ncbi:MAG: hypothetical protein EON51_15245 [Acinetobacter sp.]|nr:MAG: hypothetical protein EON51_15245 [Acinetobacter sp.]